MQRTHDGRIYDASTDRWSVVSTYCHAPGQVTPNHPTDYGVMVYDPQRDVVWWGNPGSGYPDQQGQVCTQRAPGWPTGSIYRNGFMTLNPDTNTWTKISEQAVRTIGGSYFDTAADQILEIEDFGNVPNDGPVWWKVTQGPPLKVELASVSVVQPSHDWGFSEYSGRIKWAWDNVGRIAHIPLILSSGRLGEPSWSLESG
jgi:hypothetical protein